MTEQYAYRRTDARKRSVQWVMREGIDELGVA